MGEGIVAAGLVAVAIAAPLAIGGVHPTTQVALSGAALLVTAFYVLGVRRSRGLRVVPFAAVAALAVLATALQLTPLPSLLVRVLSPGALAVREDLGTTRWVPLTLDVPATLIALCKGLACLGLLVAAANLVRTAERARQVLMPLALLGAAMAILSFVQRALGMTAILGVYHLRSTPGSGFFGTMVAGNNAAALFLLTALIAAGLAVELRDGGRVLMVGCAVAATAGMVSTGSRGGALGFAVGGFLLAASQAVGRVGRTRGLVVATLFCALLGGATLFASAGLRDRLTSQAPAQLLSNSKTRGWADAASMTRAFAVTGVGRGAFDDSIGMFRRDDEGVRLVYPENLLLQIGSEWGVPVALLLLLLAALATRRLAASVWKLEAAVVGAAAGVVGVLLHELSDFGLEMSGVAVPTVIALGVVIGRAEESAFGRRYARPRLSLSITAPLLAAWAVALIPAAWATRHTLDADFDRAQASLHGRDAELEIAAAIRRHPASDTLELLAAEAAMHARNSDGELAAIKHINRALRLHPAGWQAHRLAARWLGRHGRAGQAALEFKRAGELGMSGSFEEIARVCGVRVVDAVPQTPERLIDLGSYLVSHQRGALADAALIRAADLSNGAESVLAQRLRLAAASGSRELVRAAAQALLDAGPQPGSYALAAQLLAGAGETGGADDALRRGIEKHPRDASLLLLAARMRLASGDLGGARALLKRTDEPELFTLRELQQAEEVNAQIAERAGDPESALLARLRARSIGRKLEDTTGL